MPPHIYTEGLPEQRIPVPEWGHLPLDIYLLEQWDTPYADAPNELPDQRHKRLVRQWLNLGATGREPYFNRTRRELATYAPAQPTQAEIETILRPLRPDSLRRYADYTGDEGMWVRICYDVENEQVRAAFWDKYVEHAQVISADSLVFDDKELFENADIARVLELFPERVTNSSTPEQLAFAERELRKSFDEWLDSDEKQRVLEEEQQMISQGRGEEVARGYWSYQADCVVAHLFIEDAEAQTAAGGGGVLHAFLDDCGNLVRKERVTWDQVDNFDGAWFEGHWKEGWASDPDGGELGAAYLPGGVRGPPYNL
ncbi:hypothetical protein ASPSYDRAFT_94161 [Aspergillus sydowii CBS 593.65]|uniref:Uncharacterized protein n=1 Tax=Aspergillus sydowii CBS 593.65 TaxID=1036612 RepID=A0A1L9T2G3_9EURO|nr:uncharacterized protein ASPSYDRAFT_94161 [Aspergillus sydowii CBS 593.65]OJJ53654.1 hypothetical protein ASPSYDRAFT_94161 [Aspergillus sydowii CBS 593.65]